MFSINGAYSLVITGGWMIDKRTTFPSIAAASRAASETTAWVAPEKSMGARIVFNVKPYQQTLGPAMQLLSGTVRFLAKRLPGSCYPLRGRGF